MGDMICSDTELPMMSDADNHHNALLTFTNFEFLRRLVRFQKLGENHAVPPDVLVPSDPTAWAAGRDRQLDAAVRALLPDAGGPCPTP